MKKFRFIFIFTVMVATFSASNIFAEEINSSDVMSKMREISEKQDRILAELETIKSELNVVKIRISSS